jgi:uncharacterized membrane protein
MESKGDRMYFEFADRQFWDTLIFIVFGIGVVAAVIRLYTDFTRPLPGQDEPPQANDTQPHRDER